jgi:hypothetical protein
VIEAQEILGQPLARVPSIRPLRRGGSGTPDCGIGSNQTSYLPQTVRLSLRVASVSSQIATGVSPHASPSSDMGSILVPGHS